MAIQERVLLRNSERSSYKRCRWKWDLSYNRQVQKRTKKVPLEFGSMVHDALEKWYIPGRKRGEHPSVTFKALYDEFLEEHHSLGMWSEEGDWEEAGELGLAMLDNYIDTYGDDPLIEIIQPEQPFQYDIHHPETGEYVVTAVGTFDAIFRDLRNGKIGLLEHKTFKSLRLDHLQLDEQAGTYWALAPLWLREQGLFEEGEEIEHILYNILRKSSPDPRPRNERGQYLNKNGTVSKRQPPPFFKRLPVYRDPGERTRMIKRICEESVEHRMVRAGELPVYKTPAHDCSWSCDFFDVCEIDEVGGDVDEMVELTCEPWDPYGSHREEASLYED